MLVPEPVLIEVCGVDLAVPVMCPVVWRFRALSFEEASCSAVAMAEVIFDLSNDLYSNDLLPSAVLSFLAF